MKTTIWLVLWVTTGNGQHFMAQQPLADRAACTALAATLERPVSYACATTQQAVDSILADGCILIRTVPNGTDIYACREAP